MARTFHPELVATVIDLLAGQARPVTSSTLSREATSAMRRLVKRGVVIEDEVLTMNASGGHWVEVSGTTVSAILASRDDVVITGKNGPWNPRTGKQGGERLWATTYNVAAWEARDAKLVAEREAANTSVWVRERPGTPGTFDVISDNRKAAVFVGGTDEFGYATGLTVEQAKELAEDTVRKIKKFKVQAAMES